MENGLNRDWDLRKREGGESRKKSDAEAGLCDREEASFSSGRREETFTR